MIDVSQRNNLMQEITWPAAFMYVGFAVCAAYVAATLIKNL